MTEPKAQPKTGDLLVAGGYESSRFNALRHGVLSRHTVLAWEDPGEYEQLSPPVRLWPRSVLEPLW